MSARAQSVIASRPRQLAVHIDHHRIVCEARRKFLLGAGVDRPQVSGDRPGQAQFLRELLDLRHRSPPFPTPLCQTVDRCVQDIVPIGLIAIGYRSGTASSSIFRGGWRRGTLRPRRTTPASGSTSALATDSGSRTRDRFQVVRSPQSRREDQFSGQVVSRGGTSNSSTAERSDGTRATCGARPIRNAARRIHRECLMAGRGTRLAPPLPGALSRRRTAAESAAESATARGRSIWPTGCRVHVQPAEARSGAGSIAGRSAQPGIGCSCRASAQ